MAEKSKFWLFTASFKFKPHRTKSTVLGTFSSDDDHASENVRKQSVLINKTLALHVRYKLWFISLSAMQCVSNACALVVTAAKLILHCIQVYVFGTVPRFTGFGVPCKTFGTVLTILQYGTASYRRVNVSVLKNLGTGAQNFRGTCKSRHGSENVDLYVV